MKKLTILIAILFITVPVMAQKKNSVDEFNFSAATKSTYKSYKNGFEVANLKTDFGSFKKGDALTINQPSDPNLNSFASIGLGKYSVMNAMSMVMMARGQAKTSVIIDKIRVYKPAMGQPGVIVVDIIKEDGSNLGGMYKRACILNLERAVSLNEIINPNAPLNREQAIAKLKEAKELLEIDMMSQEEFDVLKEELSPIIRGN